MFVTLKGDKPRLVLGFVRSLSPNVLSLRRVNVVIVNGDPNPNRPDLPHYGGGETICKPTLAAVGNAIFDATGVRIRRVPFRDARVLSALKVAGL